MEDANRDEPWVLVVSTDDGTAQELAKLFREDGLHARATARGGQALRLASVSSPALAILDGDFEDISGPKLAACLRRIDNRILVIVATDQDGTLEQESREAGIVHYAPKPLDVPRLHAIGQRTLASRRGAQRTE